MIAMDATMLKKETDRYKNDPSLRVMREEMERILSCAVPKMLVGGNAPFYDDETTRILDYWKNKIHSHIDRNYPNLKPA